MLGDLLHHKRGLDRATVDAFARWRAASRGLRVTLVRGNHDRAAGDPPREWAIECVSGPVEFGPFSLVHEPPDDHCPPAPTLAGHIHPCVRLYGGARQSMRAPCFYFNTTLALLPAFGSFTGTHPVAARPGDRVFAVGDDRVIPLTGR